MVLGVARKMARRAFHARTIDYKQWTSLLSLVRDESTTSTFQGAAINFLEPATILRMRGFVSAAFDETMQVGDEFMVTFGLGIISSDAFAAGAASIPDPASEPEYPWLWWGAMFLQANVAAAQEVWGQTAMRLEVDSKAMRRVKPRESLTWIVQTAGAAGAPVVHLTFGQTRVFIGT